MKPPPNRKPITNILLTFTEEDDKILDVLLTTAAFTCMHVSHEYLYGFSLREPMTRAQIKKAFKRENKPFIQLQSARWDVLLHQHCEDSLFMARSGITRSNSNAVRSSKNSHLAYSSKSANQKNLDLLFDIKSMPPKSLMTSGRFPPEKVKDIHAMYHGLNMLLSQPKNTEDIIRDWPYQCENIEERNQGLLSKKRHLWIYGPKGSGKSALVQYLHWVKGWKAFFMSTTMESNLHYGNEHLLWVDEFVGGGTWTPQLLNKMCDDNGPINIKNSQLVFNPIRWVIITTNISMENIYKDDTSLEILRDRFHEMSTAKAIKLFNVPPEDIKKGYILQIQDAKKRNEQNNEEETRISWSMIDEEEEEEEEEEEKEEKIHLINKEHSIENQPLQAKNEPSIQFTENQRSRLEDSILSKPVLEGIAWEDIQKLVKYYRAGVDANSGLLDDKESTTSKISFVLPASPKPILEIPIHRIVPSESPKLLVKRRLRDADVLKAAAQDTPKENKKKMMMMMLSLDEDDETEDRACDRFQDMIDIKFQKLDREFVLQLEMFLSVSFPSRSRFFDKKIYLNIENTKIIKFGLQTKATGNTVKLWTLLWYIDISTSPSKSAGQGNKTPDLPGSLIEKIIEIRANALD